MVFKKISYNYLINLFNFKNFVTYAAATGSPLLVKTFTRHYIGDYRAIDHLNPDIIINDFWLSGSLLYARNGYSIRTIGLDEVLSMEVVQ